MISFVAASPCRGACTAAALRHQPARILALPLCFPDNLPLCVGPCQETAYLHPLLSVAPDQEVFKLPCLSVSSAQSVTPSHHHDQPAHDSKGEGNVCSVLPGHLKGLVLDTRGAASAHPSHSLRLPLSRQRAWPNGQHAMPVAIHNVCQVSVAYHYEFAGRAPAADNADISHADTN